MRFFTRDWHSGTMGDEQAALAEVRYATRLAEIQTQLPQALRDRTESAVLHDAQFQRCTVNHRLRLVSFSLIGGDNQVGYRSIDLNYNGVDFSRLALDALRSAVADPDTEILYHELDVEGELFVHRYLAWPYQEFDIYFRDAQLQTSPGAARLPRQREVKYVEIAAPAI